MLTSAYLLGLSLLFFSRLPSVGIVGTVIACFATFEAKFIIESSFRFFFRYIWPFILFFFLLLPISASAMVSFRVLLILSILYSLVVFLAFLVVFLLVIVLIVSYCPTGIPEVLSNPYKVINV